MACTERSSLVARGRVGSLPPPSSPSPSPSPHPAFLCTLCRASPHSLQHQQSPNKDVTPLPSMPCPPSPPAPPPHPRPSDLLLQVRTGRPRPRPPPQRRAASRRVGRRELRQSPAPGVGAVGWGASGSVRKQVRRHRHTRTARTARMVGKPWWVGLASAASS